MIRTGLLQRLGLLSELEIEDIKRKETETPNEENTEKEPVRSENRTCATSGKDRQT